MRNWVIWVNWRNNGRSFGKSGETCETNREKYYGNGGNFGGTVKIVRNEVELGKIR